MEEIDFSVVADVICVPPQTSIFSHCIELGIVVSSHIGFLLYSVDCAAVVIYGTSLGLLLAALPICIVCNESSISCILKGLRF